MKKLKYWIVVGILLSAVPFAAAWNLSAKGINALVFKKNGRIEFTLFEEGTAGEEFQCAPGASRGQWFFITPCPAGDARCEAAVDRMGSMLLAAKLAGRVVHVQRSNCEVTEVALKP